MNRQRFLSKIICLFGVLSFLTVSCKTNKAVSCIWDYIQERPDSALTVLESLPSATYKGRTLADYRLLKAMALDKSYIDVASDSLALPAYNYFHKYGPREKEMMSLYFLGVSQYYSRDYQQAIISLDSTLRLAEECHNTRYIGYTHMMMSYVYKNNNNFIDAIETAQSGIRFLSMVPDSVVQVRRAKQQLADCYIANLNYPEACSIYEDILQIAPNDTFLQRRGLPLYAWALYYSDKSKAQESLNLMNRAISNYNLQLSPEQAQHYAIFLLSTGQKDKALSISRLLEQQRVRPELLDYLNYLILKSDGKYEEALGFYELLISRQNEWALNTMLHSLTRLQRDYHQQQRKTEELKTVHSRTLFYIVFLFLLSIISGIVIFFIIRHKQHSLEKEELLARLEDLQIIISGISKKNDELKSDLDEAKSKYIEAYKSRFQRLSSLVETYYSSSDKTSHRELVYREVQRLASEVGRDYSRMRHLENMINKSMDNVMALYREEFPGKDKKHYYLVCYLFAGYPGSLIEVLTGITRSTVYSKKNRLISIIEESDVSHKSLFLSALK